MSVAPVLAPIPYPSASVSRLIEKAVRDFGLIEPGDRIAVGISGGKDSLLLYLALDQLRQRSDFDFEITGLHLDQRQPGFDRKAFDANLEALGIECLVIEEDTHSVVQENLKPGQIPCSICGRLRRGILNKYCDENGFTRLALGHHLDDAVETFFLNLLFQRRLDPLKALTPSERGVSTIRPLILVEERKIVAWVAQHGLAPVACPICDEYPESKRRDLKTLLTQFEKIQPEFRESVRAALYGGGI